MRPLQLLEAIMEGAKGGCLAVLMANAGWHGKITGLCVESRIPSQVLRDVTESLLRRMRPDMLLIEKHTGDNLLPKLHDLERPRHRRCCRVHVVEVGFCTEVAYSQKYKGKHEQHRTLLELLKSAGYADVQLHLLIFESTDGMFKLTALHLKGLGVSHVEVDSLLQNMHWKALRRLEHIVGTRRRLEHNGYQGIQRRPLANKRKHGTQQGWGLVCSIAFWAPPFPLMPKQANLFGSGALLIAPCRASCCGSLPQAYLA